MIIKIIRKILRVIRGGTYSVKELRQRGVTIGENCHIYTNNIDVNHGFLIFIGNNVTISYARILAHDGSTKKILGYSRVGKVIIGDDVFIGADAIILPNVTIGNKVIVGAGTVVAKNIPDNSIVVGNPAKIIGTFDDYIEKNRNLMKEGRIYDTIYSKKTNEEKNIMLNDLKDGKIGFDL